LLLPFLFTSIPATYLGGMLKISDDVYMHLLYQVLTIVAIRLLLFSRR
jgi:hypothetical protein